MMSTPGGRYGMGSSQVELASSDFGMAIAVPPPSKSFDLHTSCGESSSESRSPEMSVVKASDRQARIKAEKHRRSQYNSQITQIMSLLPDIVSSRRKVDKTSVLRLAADKLRNEHIFGDTIKCNHLEKWSSAVMKFFDLIGGFMLGVTCKGRIFLASPNIQEKLGYNSVDLMSQDVYNYVHIDDKATLRHYIFPPELQQVSPENRLFEQHLNFQIRLLRAGPRTDPSRFERCCFDGLLRRADRATANGVQEEQQIRRQRVRQNRTFSSSGNDFVFIGMVQIMSIALPARILPPSAYSEYWTRHLLDGRIVQCDQSISLAAGYMIEEVTGTSAFVFMHKEDVRWVICVLRQMYDQNREFGESYYRLMSRSGSFIYMRTRGFLEINEVTKKVQSFVCINNVIGEEYGKRMMEEMKKKYSVIVDMDIKSNDKLVAIDDIPVEHPKRLERIVMHLVEPSGSDAVDELKLVAPSRENIITAIKNSEKVVQETGIRFDKRKRKNSDDDDYDHLKRHNGLLDC